MTVYDRLKKVKRSSWPIDVFHRMLVSNVNKATKEVDSMFETYKVNAKLSEYRFEQGQGIASIAKMTCKTFWFPCDSNQRGKSGQGFVVSVSNRCRVD